MLGSDCGSSMAVTRKAVWLPILREACHRLGKHAPSPDAKCSRSPAATCCLDGGSRLLRSSKLLAPVEHMGGENPNPINPCEAPGTKLDSRHDK